jgi:short-subunit dehydrogenase
MHSWRGKVAIVTGGSAGLGRAISEAFCQAGGRVVLAARDPEKLAATTAELNAAGYSTAGIVTDVTRPESVAALIAETVARFGRLDVLVNNAGRSSRGEAATTTTAEFRELLEVNFLATVECTRAALPHLISSRGHVVNIGSLAAKTASRFLGAYPASKFPLVAYSQQLRLELRAQGLHVLLVCPGPIAREDAGRRYDEQAANLPPAARKPGGGVKLKGIDPRWLAQRIVRGCERRKPELVVPGKARLLFALAQLSPTLGDWLLTKMTPS